MKTYTIKELKELSRTQGYKLAALEDNQGKRLQPFNRYDVTLNKQLDTIMNRLGADLFANGVYYVLLSENINKSKNPDRYAIVKGKLTAAQLQEEKNPVTIIQSPTQEVLSWEAALSYQNQISELKSQVKNLELENAYLQEQLDSVPELSEGADKPDTSFGKYLSDAMPSITPILDRYFDIEEKKLDLQKMKMQGVKKPIQRPGQKQPGQNQQRKPIEVGTQGHMNLIEHYFNTEQDDKLNLELDKLFEYDEELYNKVCDKLGIESEEEEEEEEQHD